MDATTMSLRAFVLAFIEHYAFPRDVAAAVAAFAAAVEAYGEQLYPLLEHCALQQLRFTDRRNELAASWDVDTAEYAIAFNYLEQQRAANAVVEQALQTYLDATFKDLLEQAGLL